MASKSFLEAFEKVVKPTFEKNAVLLHRHAVAEIGGTIVKRTPIDRGYAKGNWNASLNSSTQSYNEKDTSHTGIRAKRKMLSQVPAMKFKNGSSIFIKNAVVGYPREDGSYSNSVGGGYIIQLENGKSKQAPTGIIAPIMPIIGDIVKKAKRSLL